MAIGIRGQLAPAWSSQPRQKQHTWISLPRLPGTESHVLQTSHVVEATVETPVS